MRSAYCVLQVLPTQARFNIDPIHTIRIILWTIFRHPLAPPAAHVASASLPEGRQPVTRLDGAGGMRGRRTAKRSRGGWSGPLVRPLRVAALSRTPGRLRDPTWGYYGPCARSSLTARTRSPGHASADRS